MNHVHLVLDDKGNVIAAFDSSTLSDYFATEIANTIDNTTQVHELPILDSWEGTEKAMELFKKVNSNDTTTSGA